MFDQVCILLSTVCALYVISSRPFASDLVIAQKFPKVHKIPPVMIGGRAQDSIASAVDSRRYGLGLCAVFKFDMTHVNNINSIHTQ